MVFRPPSRTTLACSVFLLLLLQLLGQTDAYSKYGRGCSDIGCLSSETCVMAHDSCSYNQRENKDCGRYPTCKKIGSAGASSPGAVLNPMPENTRPNYNTNTYQDPQTPTGNAQYPQYPQYPAGGQQPQQPPYYQQQPYPNQPYPNQPPVGVPPFGQNPPYPYGNPNPYSNPSNFPSFPNYRNIPTTTEPSLWNQFLYNKQRGYNGYPNGATGVTVNSLVLLSAALVSGVVALLRY